MRILVGAPRRQWPGDRAIYPLHAGTAGHAGAAMGWESTKAMIISTARNLLASQVLETDHTHLLFVDADVSFPAR